MKRIAPFGWIVLLALSSAPAAASERLAFSGYVKPSLELTYRPGALPRDQWSAGLESTVAGLQLHGTPFTQWSYDVIVEVGGKGLPVIAHIDPVDTDGDGNPDDVTTTETRLLGLRIENATVTWRPSGGWKLALGQMRIPFTVQHQSANTALMFPTRSGPNELFLPGTNLGILGAWEVSRGQQLVISSGLFNGIDLTQVGTDRRGALLTLRADYNAMGPFPFGESDTTRGPLRVGIGAGFIYYPSMLYDTSGFEGTFSQDFRGSVSLRFAYRGLYVQTEAMRRQATDTLSNRGDVTTGAYAQAAFYLPFGLEPAARIGYTIEDQTFDPRRTVYTEAGANLYLRPRANPQSLKLSLHYVGELRVSEQDEAHGALVQLQLKW